MGDAINPLTNRHLSGRPAGTGQEQQAWDAANPDYAQRWGMLPSTTPSKPGPGRPSVPMTMYAERPPTNQAGNYSAYASPLATPSKPGPGRPSVPMQPAERPAPGRAQSQQSPYATATPYGAPQFHGVYAAGTSEEYMRQNPDTPYAPPQFPRPADHGVDWSQRPGGGIADPHYQHFNQGMFGFTPPQQNPQAVSWPPQGPPRPADHGVDFRQGADGQIMDPRYRTPSPPAMPFGGQNAGIPPFQFRATDFMGNQFSDPGAFTSQQGAMAQALNQQRAQGVGQGQFGPLNPQMAYRQGAEMVQGGWQNPFAAPQPENQIRRLLGPQPARTPQMTPQSESTPSRRSPPPAANQQRRPPDTSANRSRVGQEPSRQQRPTGRSRSSPLATSGGWQA